MSDALLLDTDVLIDHLRGHAPARSYLEACRQTGVRMLISVITMAEMFVGASMASPSVEREARRLLASFESVSIDAPTAEMGGTLVRWHGCQLNDGLIAASAIRQRATLVTRNVRDFSKIQGLRVKKPY